MVAKINADTSNGVVITSDTSGEIELQANGVTKAKITANGLQDANGASLRGGMYRNLIINGDMQIAQRGTSASVSGNSYKTLDRWYHGISGSTAVYTSSQSTDVPSGQGFSSSLKMQCTTAYTSYTGGQQAYVAQIVEAQNCQHLKFGTSNAESLTASFWVKSNVTGDYVVWFYTADNARQTNKIITINSADTWEKKTVTISGDTGGAINNDNGHGLYFRLILASGPSLTSGTSPDGTWEAYSDANAYAGIAVNLSSSTSNYINITGVQLEVGSGASDFEFLPYDVQLARCQRYYYVCNNIQGTAQVIGVGFMYDGTRGRLYVPFPVNMRNLPSIVSTNISSSIEFNLNGNAALGDVAVLPFVGAANIIGAMFQVTITSGSGTAGESRYVRYTSTSPEIAFDAEL
jgi:hypothetical protein